MYRLFFAQSVYGVILMLYSLALVSERYLNNTNWLWFCLLGCFRPEMRISVYRYRDGVSANAWELSCAEALIKKPLFRVLLRI